MKAIVECLKCGEKLTTNYKRCIESGTAVHTCKGEKEWDVIDVKWKKTSETEQELNEIENKE